MPIREIDPDKLDQVDLSQANGNTVDQLRQAVKNQNEKAWEKLAQMHAQKKQAQVDAGAIARAIEVLLGLMKILIDSDKNRDHLED